VAVFWGCSAAMATLSRILVFAAAATAADAQFGGGGYTPPPPLCQAFKCPKGEKAVGKRDTKVVSYGCKDSGMNVFNMASFDPNNPMAGMQGGKNLNKCCVERDICKQTCGMTSKECHENFQKCQAKICKGDQNCQLQAMISDMSNDPFDEQSDRDYLDKDKKYDPQETKCRGYINAQAAVCDCVPKDDVKTANEAKLKLFYEKHNPEKLTLDGDIKDVDDVWKKWKGKEPSMFVALATKYKDKVVQMKEKPKPPPYTPPPRDSDEDLPSEFNADVPRQESAAAAGENDADAAVDEADAVFKAKLAELEAKKEKAKSDEDFDLAAETKVEISTHKAEEVKRLQALKAEAIGQEEYGQAKSLKQRIAKLEL